MAKPNILLVEDEELMRSILRQLLEEENYHVFTASSAETALEIFPTVEVDVTLTDIKMSGMDGLELLSQIKAIDEDAMVIVMTAYSSVDSAIAALRRGVDPLLQRVRLSPAQREAGDVVRLSWHGRSPRPGGTGCGRAHG